jgi:phosphotransferase system  glucose/maltose/N-acetylglucosamine-specific IIC component
MATTSAVSTERATKWAGRIMMAVIAVLIVAGLVVATVLLTGKS